MKTIDLAKDIVFLCKQNNYQFNNTKIQKLLYLFVGFCLINNIDDVFTIDEKPKLWPYGPIFPMVHKRFDLIKENCQQQVLSNISKEALNILKETIRKWGKVSAGHLSNWSHIEGSPWDIMVKKGADWNIEISLELIKFYFVRNVENVI